MASLVSRRKAVFRRFRRREDGAAAVEFALVITPVLMILIGIVDFSIVAWRTANLDHAALQLHSAVRQNLVDSGTYRSVFCDAASNLVDCDSDQLTLRVGRLPSANLLSFSNGYALSQTEPFVIQARYRHEFLTPLLANILSQEIVETQLVLYGSVN